MKKWYDEEYAFTVEVTGFLHGDHTERYCRNGEEIGDRYTCTYGCPVNQDGYGICSKTMMMLYPLMEAVRSGGDLENLDGSGKYIPIGMAAGDPYHQMESFDLIRKLAKDVEKNIIIGHSPEVYKLYPSKKYDDQLSVAEISLAGGHASVVL